jgi:hypothetical protein
MACRRGGLDLHDAELDDCDDFNVVPGQAWQEEGRTAALVRHQPSPRTVERRCDHHRISAAFVLSFDAVGPVVTHESRHPNPRQRHLRVCRVLGALRARVVPWANHMRLASGNHAAILARWSGMRSNVAPRGRQRARWREKLSSSLRRDAGLPGLERRGRPYFSRSSLRGASVLRQTQPHLRPPSERCPATGPTALGTVASSGACSPSAARSDARADDCCGSSGTASPHGGRPRRPPSLLPAAS